MGRLLISDDYLVITSNLWHTISLQSKAVSASEGVQFIISLTTGAQEDSAVGKHPSHCTILLVMKSYLPLKQVVLPLKAEINTEKEFYRVMR